MSCLVKTIPWYISFGDFSLPVITSLLVMICSAWNDVSLIMFWQMIDISCFLLADTVRIAFYGGRGVASFNWYTLLASHALSYLVTLLVL